MTYEETLAGIHGRRRFSSRPCLERIHLLMSRLGNPQNRLKFVHVAGTNGKGSTATCIESILRIQGLKTGLFTSPYLEDFRERMKVSGEMIGKFELCEIYEQVAEAADELEREGNEPVNEFEFITAMALCWFDDCDCDVVILEVGLGGRCDSTNIIPPPLCSVICSISIDHVAQLGDTIAAIASEKAGIIKKGAPTVVSPHQSAEAMEVIRAACRENDSQLIIPDMNKVINPSCGEAGVMFGYEGVDYALRLLGRHQIDNALTAIEAVKALAHGGIMVEPASIREGLLSARIDGRMEIVSRQPMVIIDSAHNVGGVGALAQTLSELLPDKNLVVVMGTMEDKQWQQTVPMMASMAKRFIATCADTPRALDPERIAEAAAGHCKSVFAEPSPERALELGMADLGWDDALVICGSVILAGEMRKKLKISFS